MKFCQHFLFLFLFTSSMLHLTLQIEECNTKILNYYGFEGQSVAIDYDEVKSDLNFDYCPSISSSCCTAQDFLQGRELWLQKNRSIKGYLKKWFMIVQKIISMQSFLLNIANRQFTKNSKYCKHFNFAFFNQKVQFEKIYFFLSNALSTFAEYQKGFYCALCDYDHNKYFAQERDGNLVNVMSANFCSKIVNVFREFVYYKVNYVDPMIVNTTFLLNCYYNTDRFVFDFSYDLSLDKINDCVEQGGTGKNCIQLCKEFKVGQASDMFVGNLQQYENFIHSVENMSIEYDQKFGTDSDNIVIDKDQKYNRKFFDISDNNEEELQNFDLSNLQVEVSGFGFDLYESSKGSQFGYNGELENAIADSIGQEQIQNDDSYTNFDAKLTEEEYKNKENRKKFEEAHQAQKYQEIENTPDEATVENAENIIAEKEKKLQRQIQEDGSINTVSYRDNTLGEGAQIQKNSSSDKNMYMYMIMLFVSTMMIQ